MTGTRERGALQVERLKMDREKRGDEMKHQGKKFVPNKYSHYSIQ
jgi:hypothetical protein